MLLSRRTVGRGRETISASVAAGVFGCYVDGQDAIAAEIARGVE